MNQTLTIRIPDDLREGLQELSKSENKPVSDIVRESLRRYLSIYRFRKLRNMVLPFAEAQGILSDEDVFNIIS
jgi:predicted transcriptional regulator